MKYVKYLLVIVLFNACKSYEIGKINTQEGEILFWLYDETPNHKASFIELADAGYWDSFTFNRVIPDFVAQGGCPDTPEGFNDPEYLLAPEFDSKLTHTYGAVGAGRDDNAEKLSARCQFYIVQNKNGLHRLDGDYTIFGNVLKGMDIVDKLVQVPKDATNKPFKPVPLDISIVKISGKRLKELQLKK